MNDIRSVKSFLSFYVSFIKIITETVGVILQDNLVLSTGLLLLIGHRKEIWKPTLRALALHWSEWEPPYIYYS